MAGSFSNSWALVKASADVLRMDKELLVFPLLSGVAAALVMVSFFVPMLVLEVPFSKWSHMAYRPLAMYLAEVQRAAIAEQEPAVARPLAASTRAA